MKVDRQFLEDLAAEYFEEEGLIILESHISTAASLLEDIIIFPTHFLLSFQDEENGCGLRIEWISKEPYWRVTLVVDKFSYIYYDLFDDNKRRGITRPTKWRLKELVRLWKKMK